MPDSDDTQDDNVQPAAVDTPDQQQTTIALETVSDGALIRVMHRQEAVLLTRIGNDVFAVDDTCPHEDVSLSLGSLCAHRLQCPLHGSEFDIRSGAVLSEPASRNLRRWQVCVKGETIVLSDEISATE